MSAPQEPDICPKCKKPLKGKTIIVFIDRKFKAFQCPRCYRLFK